MKKLLSLIAAGLFASSAQAATLDFFAEAWNNERGVVDGTVIAMDGVPVTFSANGNHEAYFDHGAGLGVCLNLTASLQCNPASDDNITVGEVLTLGFSTPQVLGGLIFRGAQHGLLTTTQTFLFGTNGGTLTSYTFQEFGALSFNNVNSATFAYGGTNAYQFYLDAATVTAYEPSTVPVPPALPLLGAGLLGLGLLVRKRRS